MAAIFGALVVCLASLTYEDEEGRFQNKLEDWWIILDETRTTSLSWTASFIQAVARLTGSCLDRVFSKRLFSPRTIAVSIILSGASFFLSCSMIIAFPFISVPNVQNSHSAMDAFIMFLRFSAFAIIPAMSESSYLPWKPWLPRLLRLYWWTVIAWFTLGIAPFMFFIYFSSPNGQMTGRQLIGMIVICLGISLLCDVSYIAFTRWMLRHISKTDRISGIMMPILMQIVFLALLLVFPVYMGLKIITLLGFVATALFISIFLNSIDIFATLAAFVVAILMLIHRLMWPILQRPIYAIQRVSLINRKGWMWSVGVMLLTYSITGFPEWIKKIFE